ncbi:MAG: hypothetical protein ACK41G_05640 [Candidatus Thermochlorobacter sp.]
MKRHLGCGTHVVEGWINTAYSSGARLAKSPPLRSLLHHHASFPTL